MNNMLNVMMKNRQMDFNLKSDLKSDPKKDIQIDKLTTKTSDKLDKHVRFSNDSGNIDFLNKFKKIQPDEKIINLLNIILSNQDKIFKELEIIKENCTSAI